MLLKYLSIVFLNCFLISAESDNTVKAIWVVRDHMVRKELIDKVLEFAETNGFNHIFAQVRGRGDAYYNSSFVPKSHLVDADFDPLAYLIKSNKNNNIKVHAWINIYYLWSSKSLPKQKEHLFLQKPEWLDRPRKDKYVKNIQYLNNNPIKIDGEGFYLAPTNPVAKDYLLNVVSELSEKYLLDGIHYDYIRFHNSKYGFNNAGLSEFRKLNKINIINPDEDDSVIFSEFKRSSITNFVKEAKGLIKRNLPNSIISAAVKPNIYDAKLSFFQEWDLWLSAGYLDWAVPMNYIVDNEKFVQNMYMIKDNLPTRYHDKIIVGISTYNQSARIVGKKIRRLRKMSFNNISIFSYNVFIDNPYYWKRLKKYF